MPPDPLVGRHAYLCATCYYHPATTLFPFPTQNPPATTLFPPPLQLKIIPLPPSSPPTQNPPATTLFPPPPPTQNHPATTLFPPNSKSSRYHPFFPPNSKSSRYHPLSSSQLKILYEILLIFQSFLEGERWPALID